LSIIVALFGAKLGGYTFIALSHGENDRCLLDALLVGYLLQISTKLLTTRAITASRCGCVRHAMGDDIPFPGRGSRMLSMTTHDPTYSS